MKISFIIPSRNNIHFLKQAYNSIRKNINIKHEIVMLDDASNDGTWEWLTKLKNVDNNIIIYRNNGSERLGHTILYDLGVNLSTSKIFSIFHADMIATPNYVNNLLKHLKEKTVVCSTRIEPPLHPPGKEKIIKNFGLSIDEFLNVNSKFYKFVEEEELENKNKITNGIFAPWLMYKKDFLEIGGHDPLFAPMELEDSDIFNRMFLAKYNLIQSRDSFVYHMTCRGSRFKDGLNMERIIDLEDGTKWYKQIDSEEYKELRKIKFREWWRKWHQNVLHNEYMMPVVANKYNICFNIKNCNEQFIILLEPWCDKLNIDCNFETIYDYCDSEQLNTKFNLRSKFINTEDTDIFIDINTKNFNQQDMNYISQLSQIFDEQIEIGEFGLGNLKIKVNRIKTYTENLIKIKTKYN